MSSQCNLNSLLLLFLFSFLYFFLRTVVFPFFIISFVTFVSGQQDVAEKQFVQLTYTEAVDLLLKAKKKFEFPVLPAI